MWVRYPGAMRQKLQYLALVSTMGMIVALTTLKIFYRIGKLWRPERQHARALELVPFDMFFSGKHWFYPLFETLGNISMFVPFGLMLYMVLPRSRPRRILTVVVAGFLFSLAIEVAQYVFSVGRTDIDDLICNTIGAYVGALFAHWFGPRWHLVWTTLALLAAIAFIVLVFVSNVPCSTGLNAFCHLKEVP